MNLFQAEHYNLEAVAINGSRVDPIGMDIQVALDIEEDIDRCFNKIDKAIRHFSQCLYIHKDDPAANALNGLGLPIVFVEEKGTAGYQDIARRLILNIQKTVGVNGKYRVTIESNMPGHGFHLTVTE